MIRLTFLIIRFIFEIPYYLFKIAKYKRNPQKYPLEERIDFTRKILVKATKRARVNLDVTGVSNLPSKNGYLITPNHQGIFDILALFNGIDAPLKIVYKEELRRIKLVADVLDFMEYHAIARKNLRQSMKVIKTTTKELQEGINVAIFPEGTRSKNGNTLGEFKGGSFKAAIDAKADIVPCAVINCYKVLDSNSIKKINCEIHFFKPLTYDDYKDLTSNEIAQIVKNQIQDYINKVSL